MLILRKRQGREQTMRKKIVQQCIGAVLASLILATYPVSLVGAQMTTAMKDAPQQNEIISLAVEELIHQGTDLEVLHRELQIMLDSMHLYVRKREQSSLSLRDFNGNSLFSCRGLA